MKFDIGCGDSTQKSILGVQFNSEISDLQEFQYGKDVFQTTTNKVSILVNDSKVQRGIDGNL